MAVHDPDGPDDDVELFIEEIDDEDLGDFIIPQHEFVKNFLERHYGLVETPQGSNESSVLCWYERKDPAKVSKGDSFFYAFIGSTFLVLDVPCGFADEVNADALLDHVAMWGRGRRGAANTFKNVVSVLLLEQHPEYAIAMIDQLISDAREFEAFTSGLELPANLFPLRQSAGNGPTTLRQFDSQSAAEVALEKGVSERATRGHFEHGGVHTADDSTDVSVFAGLVTEDSLGAWEKVRSRWVEAITEKGSDRIASLGLQAQETGDNDEAVARLLKSAEPGTVWAEFDVDSAVSIGGDYSPEVRTSYTLTTISSVPSSWNLQGTYVAQKPWEKGIPDSVTSWMVIVCPRCHLLASATKEFDEYDSSWLHESQDWIDEECFACGGSGEWEWELEIGGTR